MKPLPRAALLAALLFQVARSASAPGNLPEPWKTFAAYTPGAPVGWIADARAEALRRDDDPGARAARMLAFLRSDATAPAKAYALGWLGVVGSADALPALEAAAQNPELREAAEAARRRLQGLPVAEESRAPRAAALDGVVALTTALDAADPDGTDRLLLQALGASDERVSLAVCLALRRGAGTPALTAGILARLETLPSSARARPLDALAARPGAEDAVRAFLRRALDAGPATARSGIVRRLGPLAMPDDAPALLAAAGQDQDADLAESAAQALRAARAPGVDAALVAALAGKTPFRLAALRALSDRGAATAEPALWVCLTDADPAVAGSAAKALGVVLPPARLESVLERLLAARADPDRETLAALAWDVARRHPERAVAAETLRRAAEKAATPSLRDRLRGQADKLRPQKAATLPDDRPALLPNGGEELVYLDAGTASEAARGAVRVRRVAGASYTFGDSPHPAATVDFGEVVEYAITGLDPAARLVLGLTVWDADGGGREQEVSVDGQILLPRFRPLAWHADEPTHARLHLPVPAAANADGALTVRVRRLAGPNAVVGEVWLVRRPNGDTRKRVLLVTGDDYPGHRWRETGPEFATLLRADPGLEVTLCESPAVLASPSLAEFHAVYLHFKNYANRLPLGAETGRALETFVKNGGGLVVAHFGCGAFQEWPGFGALVGRVWDPARRGHDPWGAFQVRLVAREHPAVRGLDDFTTTDELYTCLAGEADIQILAEATSKVDQKPYPMAFVLEPGKGRVFHCPLGHNREALQPAGVRALYLLGTRWAAGLD
jgi:type 1 glutamine amidotransferase